jgi:hypothetical protein
MAHQWLNEASGVDARNGTDTHTIAFGFTSTSGSLLVFLVAGAVTHDAPGPWVQQLAPVQNAELAVFTRVSAGDDEIVITNNADNYPVLWQVFEYPEDSTYLDGADEATGGTGDSRTWPNLSGLTSNAKTIIAAVARASSQTSGTASIASWAVTTNELFDQLELSDGSTDGCYFGLAYEEDVTATSVTPTATMTIGSVPFAGGAQYQMVVFAIEVASAEPEFTLEEATEANAAIDLTLAHEPVVAIEQATGSEVAVELSLAIEPFLAVEFGAESDVGQDIEIAVDVTGGFPPSIRRPVYYPRRKRNQVFT